jgi:hypothetical protein
MDLRQCLKGINLALQLKSDLSSPGRVKIVVTMRALNNAMVTMVSMMKICGCYSLDVKVRFRAVTSAMAQLTEFLMYIVEPNSNLIMTQFAVDPHNETELKFPEVAPPTKEIPLKTPLERKVSKKVLSVMIDTLENPEKKGVKWANAVPNKTIRVVEQEPEQKSFLGLGKQKAVVNNNPDASTQSSKLPTSNPESILVTKTSTQSTNDPPSKPPSTITPDKKFSFFSAPKKAPELQETKKLSLSSLLQVCETGRVNEVKEHLAVGISVNSKDPNTGKTCLHIATAGAHTVLCQYLIENGADLTIQ